MTELRKRMIESLQLRGLSERTQEAYVRAVRQLAQHYHKSPDLITDEELRQYFLHIKNVKKYSRASSTIAICGIKFFFEKTLNREFTTFKLVRAQREKKLPVVLSVEEVMTIWDASDCRAIECVFRRSIRAACDYRRAHTFKSETSTAREYWRTHRTGRAPDEWSAISGEACSHSSRSSSSRHKNACFVADEAGIERCVQSPNRR
jgi:hypothetical protein